MDIIFYNPLSKNGGSEDVCKPVIELLGKKKEEVLLHSVFDVDDVEAFLKSISEDDRIIFVGGDGTLHRLANKIYGANIKNKIYVYSAGTGNDFVRSLKQKGKIIEITKHLKKLPVTYVNGKEERFLNGVGIGLDGLVCYKVNTSTEPKNSWNYFKNTVRAFKESKKIKNVSINIDGKEVTQKRVWLCSVMNSKYLGGGMKLAPKAKRENRDLYLVIIKNVPKWLLVLILPTVYLGLHKLLLGFVKIMKVSDSIKIDFHEDTYLQMDGEVEYPVRTMEAKVFESDKE